MKKLKRFDQINVIPFIDIMLVMLVMVLTTATFIKQGIIPVDLPKAQQEEKEKDLQEMTVYITKEGKLFVDKEAVGLEGLKAKLATLTAKQTVILRSDKEATFQDFVSVMDILKELKHEQLYIVTKQE